MIFKTKDNKLIAQEKNITIEFGEKLKIGDFEVPGPGEYEVGGVLVTAPEKNIYSLRYGGTHIVFWQALNGQPKVDSEALGAIDAMVFMLGEKTSSIKDVAETLNNLEPATLILATPDLRDELIKQESFSAKEEETWKVSGGEEVTDRQLILLPCSKK